MKNYYVKLQSNFRKKKKIIEFSWCVEFCGEIQELFTVHRRVENSSSHRTGSRHVWWAIKFCDRASYIFTRTCFDCSERLIIDHKITNFHLFTFQVYVPLIERSLLSVYTDMFSLFFLQAWRYFWRLLHFDMSNNSSFHLMLFYIKNRWIFFDQILYFLLKIKKKHKHCCVWWSNHSDL